MITLLIKDYDGTIDHKLVEPKFKVSKNFKADEFQVNRGDGLDLACLSQYDLDTVQYIRTLFGISVTISSTGRTPKYNSSPNIKGAGDSKHQYFFDVMDFIVNGASVEQLDNIYDFLLLRGYTGIGRYKGNRFHIDRGYRDKLTVWDER